MAQETKSVWEVLSKINVNDKVEKKNNLTYLSWAWAWSVLKENFPNATYTVYENKDGFNYHTDGRTAWVKTGVTVEGIEHIEYLPIMDFRNQSIGADKLTSFDVNKAIQRSLTKAISRFGLGNYIYAGEDVPSDSDGVVQSKPTQPREVVPQDFSATNPNEPIRKTTVMLLNSLNEKLSVEDRAKVQAFLIKYNASSFEQLTQQQGHALVVNLTQKVTK